MYFPHNKISNPFFINLKKVFERNQKVDYISILLQGELIVEDGVNIKRFHAINIFNIESLSDTNCYSHYNVYTHDKEVWMIKLTRDNYEMAKKSYHQKHFKGSISNENSRKNKKDIELSRHGYMALCSDNRNKSLLKKFSKDALGQDGRFEAKVGSWSVDKFDQKEYVDGIVGKTIKGNAIGSTGNKQKDINKRYSTCSTSRYGRSGSAFVEDFTSRSINNNIRKSRPSTRHPPEELMTKLILGEINKSRRDINLNGCELNISIFNTSRKGTSRHYSVNPLDG